MISPTGKAMETRKIDPPAPMSEGLSVGAATITLITSMLGCGVLFLPASFGELGYLGGAITLAGLALACFATLHFISYAAFKFRQNALKTNGASDTYAVPNEESETVPSAAEVDSGLSYYAVAASHSRFLAMAVDTSIILQGIGCCVCYIQTIVDWLAELFALSIPRPLLNAVAMMPLYGLSILKSLSALRFASYLSVSAVVYLTLMLLFYAATLRGVLPTSTPPKEFALHGAVSRILFALGSHQNLVQVFSELKNKRMSDITAVSAMSYVLGPLLYLVIGLAGFFVAGTSTEKNIYMAFVKKGQDLGTLISEKTFDKSLFIPKLGLFMFLFVLLCSFPMQMHPTRNSVTNLLLNFKAFKAYPAEKIDKLKFVITTTLCLSVYFISIIPNLEPTKVVNLIGATATVGIVFIFPAIIYAMTIKKMCKRTIAAGTVGVLGVLTSGYLVYSEFKPT